ncbi:MAG TPA: DUF4266 domain-containing protein [Polyangiales bacterium]|nr:DUF4266 domain-containing protein [Polyangiales bacterium]
MSQLSRVLIALALCAGAFGCSHVKPYEREYMTRPGMDTESEEFAQEFEAHVQNAREGATGRGSIAGGGCGCN